MEEAVPASPESPSSYRRWLVLAAVIVGTTVPRVWVIRHFPEPDSDAKGHLGIAKALLHDPFNVAVHWLWPPGYHYFLAALLGAGVTAQGVRLLDCALAALLPVLVWRYGERTLSPSASPAVRHVPFLAALLCAAMPVVNLLGTSAQQESLFTVLIVAAAFALDAERFALGGILLAVASTIRTETWGAIGLLAGLRALGFVFPRLVDRLPEPVARACRLPLVTVVPGLLAVAGWFLAHRLSDGSWLAFVRETHRYTHLQRATFHQEGWAASRWFLCTEPYYLFGLTLPLFFLGLHRAFRAGFFVPLGLYLFLLVSWFSGSALDHSRYYESVAPFVCLAAAHGVAVIGERWRTGVPVLFTAAFAHVVWLLVLLGRATFHL